MQSKVTARRSLSHTENAHESVLAKDDARALAEKVQCTPPVTRAHPRQRNTSAQILMKFVIVFVCLFANAASQHCSISPLVRLAMQSVHVLL